MNNLARLFVTMTAAVLIGGGAFASETLAATAQHAETLAQTTPAPTPAATAQGQAKNAGPTAYVETRIKELHQKLHITAAQEDAWNNVAQVMRENAQSMEPLIHDRFENSATMTAVDDLRSYSALADAHAEGLKKFIPAFEQLYDSMSDAQKKNADALFRNRVHHSRTKAAPAAQ